MRVFVTIISSVFFFLCLTQAALLGVVVFNTWGDDALPTSEARQGFLLATICVYAAVAVLSDIRGDRT